MKAWLLVLVCALLAGCAATTPPPAPHASLFKDQLFAAPAERIGTDEVFALSDEMRRYLQVDIAVQLRRKGTQLGLLESLYTAGELKLEYDSALTRNASQAFAAKAGNCLSLVIMTAAFAKELGLAVQYQSVFVPSNWSRYGNLYVSSAHVNLSLGRRPADPRVGYDSQSSVTVDFFPSEDTKGQHSTVIEEHTILAMYLNNRAAESLAAKRLDAAYAWARAAVFHDPGFTTAYNTLAVVYLHHGNLAEAEQVLRHVLEREPGNVQVLANLASLLERGGRSSEAQALTRRLAQIEGYPPYHFFNLGMEALRSGELRTARSMFSKEVDRAAYQHEFHYWLAVTDYALGDLRQAREHLALALQHSTTPSARERYTAKLELLKAKPPQ